MVPTIRQSKKLINIMAHNIFKIKKTWCEYLTPCPYKNRKGDPAGTMIGDYDCSRCYWLIKYNNAENTIECKHPIE